MRTWTSRQQGARLDRVGVSLERLVQGGARLARLRRGEGRTQERMRRGGPHTEIEGSTQAGDRRVAIAASQLESPADHESAVEVRRSRFDQRIEQRLGARDFRRICVPTPAIRQHVSVTQTCRRTRRIDLEAAFHGCERTVEIAAIHAKRR